MSPSVATASSSMLLQRKCADGFSQIPPLLQPDVRVSSPEDPYEQEADLTEVDAIAPDVLDELELLETELLRDFPDRFRFIPALGTFRNP